MGLGLPGANSLPTAMSRPAQQRHYTLLALLYRIKNRGK